MAEYKRKKLIKQSESPVSNYKFVCCCCGTAYTKPDGHFTVSYAPLYRGTKRLPFCVDCADIMFEKYVQTLGNERDAMRRMCMKADVYWSHAIADMVEVQPTTKSYIRNYVSKSNLKGFIGKTYDDTIKEEQSGTAAVPVSDLTEDLKTLEREIVVPPEVALFWGAGLPPAKIMELEDRFQYLKSRYHSEETLSLGEETLFRQIAALEIDNNYDRAAGKSVEKNTALINTLLGSINLKPVQQKAEESDGKLDGMPLGVGIRKWEEERPLPPTPEELKDVSGMVKAITTWFYGHMCKMVGIKNGHCTLYEEAMEELRVNPMVYEDDDDDTVLADLFGEKKVGDVHET